MYYQEPWFRMLIRVKFFEVIVGRGLCEFILGCKYSMMVLAACGSVVNCTNALKELREVVNEYVRLAATIQFMAISLPLS